MLALIFNICTKMLATEDPDIHLLICSMMSALGLNTETLCTAVSMIGMLKISSRLLSANAKMPNRKVDGYRVSLSGS
jgi:hypothetical protein